MRINNTTKKYIVFPGEVKSIFDGEIHYISGHQLIRLYKLNPKEVIIANEDSGAYIIDSEGGYTTGCPHFPLPETNATSPFKHFKFSKKETNEITIKKTIMSRDTEISNDYKFLSNEEIPNCCGSCLNRTKLKCSELNDEICIWAVCNFYKRKEL